MNRWAKIAAGAALAVAMWFSPAYAVQKYKNQQQQAPVERKPVVEYIAIVVLMAIPIGLVCRSSRRQT
jgi:hypothetical protein